MLAFSLGPTTHCKFHISAIYVEGLCQLGKSKTTKGLLPDCSISVKDTGSEDNQIKACMTNLLLSDLKYTMIDHEGRLFSHSRQKIIHGG